MYDLFLEIIWPNFYSNDCTLQTVHLLPTHHPTELGSQRGHLLSLVYHTSSPSVSSISLEHKYHIFCYLLQVFACVCFWVKSANHNLKSTLATVPCRVFNVFHSGINTLIRSFYWKSQIQAKHCWAAFWFVLIDCICLGKWLMLFHFSLDTLKFWVRVNKITSCLLLSAIKRPIMSLLIAVFSHAVQPVLGVSLWWVFTG